MEAPPVRVEVHLANGLPSFALVGLPEAEVREARERVRAAISNSGFEFPARRIIVNLAPAELPKESGRFDLPIAIGILVASGQLRRPRRCSPDAAAWLDGHEFAGELALTGDFIDAERAYALGFINELTEGPSLEAAKALAARVAANGPLALIASKAIVRDSHEWTEAEMWDKQEAYIAPVFTSSDAREGALAFAEKRKPNWQGK
jgi:predicted ATPase with chaperone activity